MFLIDNSPRVQLRLNSPTIANRLFRALSSNIDDNSTIKLHAQSVPPKATELVIDLDTRQVAARLAAHGISIIRIHRIYVIAVEKELTKEKEYFPVDAVNVRGDFEFTKLGLIESIKVLAICSKHYRIHMRLSIVPTDPSGIFSNVVGVSGIETQGGHHYDWGPLPLGKRFMSINEEDLKLLKPTVEDYKAHREQFWSSKADGDDLRNTTFDAKSVRPHAGGYHVRDTKLEATHGLDPEHGDIFQNRSFDQNNDPYGHDATHGEAAGFDLQTTAGLSGVAQSGETASVELDTRTAQEKQLDQDFEGSGPLLFQGGPIAARDPVLQRGMGADYDMDETFALSAHDISGVEFDTKNGNLNVVFDEQKLWLSVNPEKSIEQHRLAIQFDIADPQHTALYKYLLTGGWTNFKNELAEALDVYPTSFDESFWLSEHTLVLVAGGISAKNFNKVVQTFNLMKGKAKLPRDKGGNVADVELESDKVLPKSGKNIRIADEGVFINIDGVEYPAQVKPWDDKSLLLVSTEIGHPKEAELKIMAVVLKANYGGKAKGDIEIFIVEENDTGERGLVLVFGAKPRFSHLRFMLEKHLVK